MADVRLVDPKTGEIFTGPEEEAAVFADANGLRPATPKDVEAYELQQKKGGLAGQAQAAVAGAGRAIAETIAGGVTSVLGGKVMDRGGDLYSEDASRAIEANPTAAAVGSAAPAVASSFLIPGSGLTGLAARAAVGGALEEGAETAITGDEYSVTDAASYGLLQGGFELAMVGGGWALKKLAGRTPVEDSAATAARALIDDAAREPIGATGAAKRAVAGEAVLEQKTAEAIEAIRRVESKAAASLEKSVSPASLKRVMRSDPAGQVEATLNVAIKLEQAASVMDDAVPVKAAFRDLAEKIGSADSPIEQFTAIREARASLDELGELPPAASRVADDLVALSESEALWGKAATHAKAVRGAQRAPADAFAEDRLPALLASTEGLGQLSERLDTIATAARTTRNVQLLKDVEDVRGVLKLAQGMRGESAVLGDAAGEVSKTAEQALKRAGGWAVQRGLKTALTGLGFGGGGLVGGMAADAVGDAIAPAIAKAAGPAVEKIRTWLSVQRAAKDIQISTAARSMVHGGVRRAQGTLSARPVRLRGVTASAGTAAFLAGHDSERAAFEAKIGMLRRLESDPLGMLRDLGDTAPELAEAAPELHAGLMAQAFRSLSFVRSKIPETVGVSMAHPSGIPPSKLAMRTFGLYYSAAFNPSTVVDDIKNNRVRREQIETLQAVWPDLWSQLQGAVLEEVSAGGVGVRRRMQIDSVFGLGSALDAGLGWGVAIHADRARKAESERLRAGGGTKMPDRRSQPSIRGIQPTGMASVNLRSSSAV